MKPDTIVKLRDAFTLAADALQEELEFQSTKKPTDAMPSLEGVVRKQAIGSKGPYERVDPDDKNPAYQRVLAALIEHKGTMTVEGSFVWLFDDKKTLGIKPKR